MTIAPDAAFLLILGTAQTIVAIAVLFVAWCRLDLMHVPTAREPFRIAYLGIAMSSSWLAVSPWRQEGTWSVAVIALLASVGLLLWTTRERWSEGLPRDATKVPPALGGYQPGRASAQQQPPSHP